jgi:hypothetical protein
MDLIYGLSVCSIWRVFICCIIVFAIGKKSVDLTKAEIFSKYTEKIFGISLLGAIDNTSYYIHQMHPGSGGYFRCDKKGYFISVLASKYYSK